MPKMILDWKTTHDFRQDAFIGVGVPAEDAEIVVDVLDRPGSIAVIAVLLSSNGVNIKNFIKVFYPFS